MGALLFWKSGVSLIYSIVFVRRTFGTGVLSGSCTFSSNRVLVMSGTIHARFRPCRQRFGRVKFARGAVGGCLRYAGVRAIAIPIPTGFLHTSGMPAKLLGRVVTCLGSRRHGRRGFSRLLLFSYLSVFTTYGNFVALLAGNILSISKGIEGVIGVGLTRP